MSRYNNNVYDQYRFYLCEKPERLGLRCERLGEPFCFCTSEESPQVIGIHKLIPECLDENALQLKWALNTIALRAKKMVDGKQ